MDDKTRWNQKHQNPLMPTAPSGFVKKYVNQSVINKTALDIACGTGRHTHYLADLGYSVDAVDISDYGLSRLRSSPKIFPIEADLTSYSIHSKRYDVIININYLERQLFPSIISGLKAGGLLIFETFVDPQCSGYSQPSNPDYLLMPNELLREFNSFNILEYEEYDSRNIQNEKVRIAALAAKKPI